MPSEISEIRARREAAGLSQQRLAEHAGISISMLRLLETGYEPNTSLAAKRVLTALDDAEREEKGNV